MSVGAVPGGLGVGLALVAVISIAQVSIGGDNGGPAATRVAGALSTAEQHAAELSDRLAGSRLKIQDAQAQLNRLSILSSRADTAAESELGARNKVRAVTDRRDVFFGRGLAGLIPAVSHPPHPSLSLLYLPHRSSSPLGCARDGRGNFDIVFWAGLLFGGGSGRGVWA